MMGFEIIIIGRYLFDAWNSLFELSGPGQCQYLINQSLWVGASPEIFTCKMRPPNRIFRHKGLKQVP